MWSDWLLCFFYIEDGIRDEHCVLQFRRFLFRSNVNVYFEILWTDPGTGRSKHHSTGERTKKAAQIYLAQWVLDEQADQKRGAIVIVKSILAFSKIEHVDEALLSKGTDRKSVV